MIFCKQLLFVHVPKTGGMSVTKYLLGVLPPPVYYTHPDCKEAYEADGIHHIPGLRHESMNEAKALLAKYGFDISEIPLILAGLRNPYSLEVSRYAYLRTGHPWDEGPNQDLALTADFTTFARESYDHMAGRTKLEDYFLLGGAFPSSLQVVQSENLSEEVEAALRKVDITTSAEFPWVNRSIHEDFLSYYTKEAEEAVYQRYRWIFDQGFYERLNPEMIKPVPDLCWEGRRLPLVGPVTQDGPSPGFWPDLWVGQFLSFDVRPRCRIVTCSIEGLSPPQLNGGLELRVQIDGQVATVALERERRFTWSTLCDFAPGTGLSFNLSTSGTWCPNKDGASEDGRDLGFRLHRIRFEPPQGEAWR
jgi:hypothetical protein